MFMLVFMVFCLVLVDVGLEIDANDARRCEMMSLAELTTHMYSLVTNVNLNVDLSVQSLLY
jgi:hypothetical protein